MLTRLPLASCRPPLSSSQGVLEPPPPVQGMDCELVGETLEQQIVQMAKKNKKPSKSRNCVRRAKSWASEDVSGHARHLDEDPTAIYCLRDLHAFIPIVSDDFPIHEGSTLAYGDEDSQSIPIIPIRGI